MVTAINSNIVDHFNSLAVPQDWEYAERGEYFFNAGNYTAAWAAYNEAVKINPREMLYCYMRAACSSRLGHNKAALTDYNMAMNLAKNNEEKGWVHLDLAIVYRQMGDEQSALSHLTAAARLGNGMAQNICKEAEIPY